MAFYGSEKMNFSSIISLERMTLVKIAALLWNKNCFTAYYTSGRLDFGNSKDRVGNKWLEIENKVLEKVTQLPLAKILCDKIECFIRPVGLEISKWLQDHPKLDVLPSDVFWTVQGTVDRAKTAKALIQDENIHVVRRYRLACNYCLDEDIPQLWNRILEERLRKPEYWRDNNLLDSNMFSQSKIVVFWTYNVNGQMTLLESYLRQCSPYQYAFEYAVLAGNKAATEYFFQKLTPSEKDELLVNFASFIADFYHAYNVYGRYYADVECFLLSQANEEQQMQIFGDNPLTMLRFFLDWPRQSFFTEVTNHVWGFLSKEDYYLLLEIIINKVMVGYKDYNYQNLLEELWHESPTNLRRYFIEVELLNPVLLSKLLKLKYKETFILILKDATFAEKREFIFKQDGLYISENFIYDDEGHLLEFFIRECKLSKNDMIKLKNTVEELPLLCNEELPWKLDSWNKVIQRLDDFIDDGNKRKRTTEDGNSSAKRHHAVDLGRITRSIKKKKKSVKVKHCYRLRNSS